VIEPAAWVTRVNDSGHRLSKRRLPIVLDASALALPAVFCCAGRRGLQMEIAPADLIEATGAKAADIAAA
jgi:Cys-tRNA(Pro)/Cys-tRNA(Cys) deacylase